MDIDKKLITLRDFVNRVLDVAYYAPRSIIQIYNMVGGKPAKSSDTHISDKDIVVKYYHHIRFGLVKIYSLDTAEYAKLTMKIFEVLGGDGAGLNEIKLEIIES